LNPFLANIQNNISEFGKLKNEFPKLFLAHSTLTEMGCLSFSQMFIMKLYGIDFGSVAVNRITYIDASIMMTIMGNRIILHVAITKPFW